MSYCIFEYKTAGVLDSVEVELVDGGSTRGREDEGIAGNTRSLAENCLVLSGHLLVRRTWWDNSKTGWDCAGTWRNGLET